MLHGGRTLGLTDPPGNGGALGWLLARQSLAPGLSFLRSPVLPRYDVNGGPMLPDHDAGESLRRLLQGAGAGVIAARAFTAEGPAWDALTAMAAEGAISLTIVDAWERAMLDRSAAPDAACYFDAFLSASQRKQLRRKSRALKADGALVLRIAASPLDLPAAFDAFCALEAGGWKGRARTALTHHPAGLAYVRNVMLAMAADGSSFVAELRQGGRPIASGLFLRAGGEVVFWKTAYEERLAKHSPGVVFDMMLTEWLYAQPWFERLDAGHDDSVDPGSLIWRQRRRMANVVIDLKPGSLKGLAVVALLKARRRLRAWKHGFRRARNSPG